MIKTKKNGVHVRICAKRNATLVDKIGVVLGASLFLFFFYSSTSVGYAENFERSKNYNSTGPKRLLEVFKERNRN